MTAANATRELRVPLPTDGTSHRSYQPALSEALMDVQATVVKRLSVDPVLLELVRLRCANVHDCRVCKQVRLEPARAAGLDEDTLAKVQNYEASDLSERHKVALRLADSHLLGWVPPSLPEQVAAHLTPEEALDIVLLVVKNSYQKSLVALGLDIPVEYTEFRYDMETGRNVPLR